jgi:hypothetical protein
MKPIVPRPVVNRRILLSGLAAPVLLSGLHLTAQARLPESPLASWNDGPTKQAILDFVHDRVHPINVRLPPKADMAQRDRDVQKRTHALQQTAARSIPSSARGRR